MTTAGRGRAGGITMSGMLSRALRAAGCARSAVGQCWQALWCGAAPAAASTPMNESYAVYATGRMSTQPVGQASYSGGSPVILPNAERPGCSAPG